MLRQNKLLKFMIPLSLLIIFFSLQVSAIDINTCQELQNMTLGNDYDLISDIDCSDTINWNNGSGFVPITGIYKNTFDGHGYAISDLFIFRNETDNIGLFSEIANATIQNVNFVSPRITGQGYVGVAVGYCEYNFDAYNVNVTDAVVFGTYRNIGGFYGGGSHSLPTGCTRTFDYIYVQGNVTGESIYVGGIAGSGLGCPVDGQRYTMSHMYADVNVEGLGYVGGLFGYQRLIDTSQERWDCRVAINQSYSTGTIYSDGNYGGGLIGLLYILQINQANNIYSIFDSFSIAEISGGDYLGGLFGYARGLSNGDDYQFYRLYSAGKINSVGSNANAMSGYSGSYGDSYDLYFDNESSGYSNSGLVIGDGSIFGNTTENMKKESTYTNWDFTDIWDIVENETYPFLQSLPQPAFEIISLDLNVISPSNNSQGNTIPDVEFNVESSSQNTIICDFYLDSVLNQTNSSVLNGTTSNFIISSLTDGTHTFEIICNDTELETSSGVFNLYYDSHEPQIYSMSPMPFNTTTFSDYTMNFYGNVTNHNISLVNRTIYRPNGTIYYNDETSVFVDETIFVWNQTFNTTPEDNGIWSYYIHAEDLIPNTNDLHISFTIDNCVPDWSCDSFTACNSSDQQLCNGVVDINNCSYPYNGDYSEFGVLSCNYCDMWIHILNETECRYKVQDICYEDLNFATCCDVTKLESDCYENIVQNESIYCKYDVTCSIFDYVEADISKSTISLIGKMLIEFGKFVVLAVLFFLVAIFIYHLPRWVKY